ncbi:hypothetical protein [Methylobacterium nigriterrae]|uniref:hypothetical protein n=1 Tax=Methylobacterium nigriterrae TaxID=3127512 RepID=UPI0030134216
MYAVKAREAGAQWIELPEPALDRYLLRSRRRAANDNSRLSFGTFRTLLFTSCAATICASFLIAVLVR